jgi:hypothetical protein
VLIFERKKRKTKKQSHTAHSALNFTRADRTIKAPSTSARQKGSETLSEKEGKKKKIEREQKSTQLSRRLLTRNAMMAYLEAKPLKL